MSARWCNRSFQHWSPHRPWMEQIRKDALKKGGKTVSQFTLHPTQTQAAWQSHPLMGEGQRSERCGRSRFLLWGTNNLAPSRDLF